ncbi:transketolase family protein [Anaerofilum sp. BX8]|uniref:Transketolase family protein n=1 Tax=Anaerofilum hominis TaxID=2763016 RepID=A0A923I5K8_9FIRM|nr:transketolase C-terminal domain-containing protein [Anaerofilum hominis]MBC5580735.1 transketolase family protein [Anaerofilum hominis]
MSVPANKQVICDVLKEEVQREPGIVVLCSDSRGSGSMTSFFDEYPDHSVEVGIAEQDLVTISAGLAASGKRPFAISPASFLAARSFEQIKIDVGYSHTNVKLVGISGGVSYGALGSSHHSAQDIAAVGALPGLRVYLPSDWQLTRSLTEHLVRDDEAAYIRVGRSASPQVYGAGELQFEMDRAVTVREGGDLTIIACGDAVYEAVCAADQLAGAGIRCRVLDMYCLKPLDAEAVLRAARETGRILTVEEHSIVGGLGSLVCQVTAQACPVPVKSLALPDSEIVTGSQREVYHYYGLDAEGICRAAREMMPA